MISSTVANPQPSGAHSPTKAVYTPHETSADLQKRLSSVQPFTHPLLESANHQIAALFAPVSETEATQNLSPELLESQRLTLLNRALEAILEKLSATPEFRSCTHTFKTTLPCWQIFYVSTAKRPRPALKSKLGAT